MSDIELPNFDDIAATREDNFEAATIKDILKRLGHTPKRIRALETELGGLTWDWFNSEALLMVQNVQSRRFARFDFADLFFNPQRSPVIIGFNEIEANCSECSEGLAVIFKAVGTRVVITNVVPTVDLGIPTIHVTRKKACPLRVYHYLPWIKVLTATPDDQDPYDHDPQ